MLGKKVTFLVFPETGGLIKRYSIPKNLPWVILLVLITVLAGLLGFSSQSHQKLKQAKSRASEMKRLRQKAVQQSVQIFAFADKIKQLEGRLAKLRQFDQQLRAKTGQAPLTNPDKSLAVGGSDTAYNGNTALLKARSEDLIRQMHRDLDRLLAETSVLEVDQQWHGRILEDSRSIMASTPDLWPVTGVVSSFFGYRNDPFNGGEIFHRGVDIRAPIGTPVLAPADGIVSSVDWNSGYGMILEVNHGYGVMTRYAHLTQAYVEPGRRISRGQKIAAVGATGRVTGPHLHYEVILNGIPVNPIRYLSAKKD